MPDLALLWDLYDGDLSIFDDDLEQDAGLRTAILLSLFLDRRDPDSSGAEARGYWADEYAANPGDESGSLLWKLERAKATSTLAQDTERYCREALQWMLDDGVAEAVEFEGETNGSVLIFRVTVVRGASRSSVRFSHVWDGESARLQIQQD